MVSKIRLPSDVFVRLWKAYGIGRFNTHTVAKDIDPEYSLLLRRLYTSNYIIRDGKIDNRYQYRLSQKALNCSDIRKARQEM